MMSVPTLEEIRSLEEALHRPEVRRSKEAVDALLADDFVEFGSSGTVYDRTTTISLLAQEGDVGEGEFLASNYALTSISSDAVLLTYETQRPYRDGTKRNILRSSVWKHDGGKWRMLFHQGTVRV